MRRFRAALLGIVATVVMLTSTVAQASSPAPAPGKAAAVQTATARLTKASASSVSPDFTGVTLWFGDWDPNPATDTSDLSQREYWKAYTGSNLRMYSSYRESTGWRYWWIRLGSAQVGEQVALIWRDGYSGNWYQCGDGNGNRTATVRPGTTATWTAGVPYWQIYETASGTVDACWQWWSPSNEMWTNCGDYF
jgi:hypothetical protein